MNAKELKASRVQLFRDAANFKKTERIPHFANVVTWKVFDAGYTLDQAMTNFDILEESVVKFLDRYPVDGLMDVGIRNQLKGATITTMKMWWASMTMPIVRWTLCSSIWMTR